MHFVIKETSMRPISRFSSRPAALAALGVGGAALLLLARPLRGQQASPVMHASAPAVAESGPTTTVSYDFTLPPPFQFLFSPSVRVIDSTGRLIELLPMHVTQRTPVWKGDRGLHTENYRPGAYLVRIELDYLGPDGKQATAATSYTALTVPGH
jgi:hypothetical protein